MQGIILAYRPASGAGAILSDKGELFLFADRSFSFQVEGGDRVVFSTAGSLSNGARRAEAVRVVEKATRFTSVQTPSARQVWRTLRIEPSIH